MRTTTYDFVEIQEKYWYSLVCSYEIPFLAYHIRISANYTGASKSYLTRSYASLGKDKNREFSCV